MKASRNGVGKSKVLLKSVDVHLKSCASAIVRFRQNVRETSEAQDFINVLSFVGLLAVAGFAFGKDESKTGNPPIESRAGRVCAQTTRRASGQRKIISFGGLALAVGFGIRFFSNYSSSGLHPPRLFS